jgi:site-specific DNA-methyltransferase (adenine-specific)
LKLQHPATYPDKLAEDLILCFSEPHEVVLDPMCGSGTTCVMAHNNRRQYIGIEVSDEYCEIAKKRIQIDYQPEQQHMF